MRRTITQIQATRLMLPNIPDKAMPTGGEVWCATAFMAAIATIEPIVYRSVGVRVCGGNGKQCGRNRMFENDPTKRFVNGLASRLEGSSMS